MSASHPDLGPELRQLAQAILDRLDPAVRAAATMAGETLRGPGRCQQVWCPVCALAALISGEQHPLLTVIAEHSVSLMTVVRTMVADPQTAGGTDTGRPATPEPPPAEANGTPPPTTNGQYHRIPIVIESDDPAAPVDCP
ncbi:MAG: hypothetical protein ACR2JM_03545 [Mycobacterium sp.]